MIVACAGSQDQAGTSHTPRSVGVGAMSSRKRSGVTPILPACCPPAPFFFSGLRVFGLRLLAPLVMSALPLGGVGSKTLFLLPRIRGVPLPAAVRKGSKRKGRITMEAAVAFCSVVHGGKGARVVWRVVQGVGARLRVRFSRSTRRRDRIRHRKNAQPSSWLLQYY